MGERRWRNAKTARRKLAFGLGLLLLLVAGAAGCGQLPGGPLLVEGAQATPTATLDPSGYQAIEPQACLVSSVGATQSERRAAGMIHWQQGSLMAFQPGQDRLAYLGPSDRTSWFTGELMILAGPDFKERRSLAPSVQAAGDLTWSPSGDWLAFVAFRLSENVQTVMVVRPDGTGLADLFPTDLARTDGRTSQKAIMGWPDERTVRVIASCGETCRYAYDIDIHNRLDPAQEPTQVADYHQLEENLKIKLNLVEYEPEDFPRHMATPHWSPDGKQVVYLDRKTFPWLLELEGQVNYPLPIGLRDVIEMQWSTDSTYLALRAEDRIFVFETPCRRGP